MATPMGRAPGTTGPGMPMSAGTDDESTLQAHLEDLCAGLSDDDLHELAALAEAMHADGGV